MIDKLISTTQTPITYEEVAGICKGVLENVIGQNGYQHTEAVKWNQKIVEKITENLILLERSYKFCVSCIIMQTGLGAGLNVATTCYWDKSTDVSIHYRWESKAVIVICNVFTIAI